MQQAPSQSSPLQAPILASVLARVLSSKDDATDDFAMSDRSVLAHWLDRLLNASDAEEFLEALDELTDTLVRDGAEDVLGDASLSMPSPEWFVEAATKTLGAPDAARFVASLSVALGVWAKAENPEPPREATPPPSSQDEESLSLGRWMFDLLGALFAALAVMRGHTQGRVLPTWLAQTLTDVFIAGVDKLQPDELHEERLQRDREWNERQRSWVERARKADGPYFPYGNPQD